MLGLRGFPRPLINFTWIAGSKEEPRRIFDNFHARYHSCCVIHTTFGHFGQAQHPHRLTVKQESIAKLSTPAPGLSSEVDAPLGFRLLGFRVWFRV